MNNYTTHALEFFLKTPEGRAHPRVYPRSIEGMMMAIDAMQAGQKFVMPEYGRVFASGTRRGDFRDLLRLPYPVCVLEYFCPEPKQVEATRAAGLRMSDFFPKRRIAILLDTGHMEEFKGTAYASSIMVVGCCEVEDGFWTFMPGAAILNPDTVEIDPETGLFTIVPVPFLWEAWERPNYTFQEKVYDIGDEATAAVEFMMTINCENVKRERVEPPAKLNKKREAAGKLPFSSYWMLDVFKEQRAPGGPSQGGNHASPRLHFRRGHIRRLASGKTTFVRHTMVGSGDAGAIKKTYNVKAA